MSFENLQGWRFHSVSEPLFQCLTTLTPGIQLKFHMLQPVTIASQPFSGHLRSICLCLLNTVLGHLRQHLVPFSLFFSRLNKPNSFSLPLPVCVYVGRGWWGEVGGGSKQIHKKTLQEKCLKVQRRATENNQMSTKSGLRGKIKRSGIA